MFFGTYNKLWVPGKMGIYAPKLAGSFLVPNLHLGTQMQAQAKLGVDFKRSQAQLGNESF